MKQSVIELRQFALSSPPRRLPRSLRARLIWLAWLVFVLMMLFPAWVVVKTLRADRMVDQLRLDLLSTEMTEGRIHRIWEVEKPYFIEVEGVLRGYGFVYLVGDGASRDNHCFAYARPHEVGDPVQVKYLRSDPAVSVIHGYLLNPHLPTYRFRFLEAGFLVLLFGLLPLLRRNVVRVLETAEATRGTIAAVDRVGWKTWMVTTQFTHGDRKHSVRTIVRGSTREAILAVEESFGDLVVLVHPRKPKKSVVPELLGLQWRT